MVRERLVIRAMQESPGFFTPEDALAMVVWPSLEMDKLASDWTPAEGLHKRFKPCRGCGCHNESYTKGCRNCTNRRSIRKRREKQREMGLAA